MMYTATIQQTDDDADKAYKFRLSVHGLHSGTTSLKNNELPFGVSAGHSPNVHKIGKTPNYLPGSTVVCWAVDYPRCQQFVILGAMPASGKALGSQLEPTSYDTSYRDVPNPPESGQDKNPGFHKNKKALCVYQDTAKQKQKPDILSC